MGVCSAFYHLHQNLIIYYSSHPQHVLQMWSKSFQDFLSNTDKQTDSGTASTIDITRRRSNKVKSFKKAVSNAVLGNTNRCGGCPPWGWGWPPFANSGICAPDARYLAPSKLLRQFPVERSGLLQAGEQARPAPCPPAGGTRGTRPPAGPPGWPLELSLVGSEGNGTPPYWCTHVLLWGTVKTVIKNNKHYIYLHIYIYIFTDDKYHSITFITFRHTIVIAATLFCSSNNTHWQTHSII